MALRTLQTKTTCLLRIKMALTEKVLKANFDCSNLSKTTHFRCEFDNFYYQNFCVLLDCLGKQMGVVHEQSDLPSDVLI